MTTPWPILRLRWTAVFTRPCSSSGPWSSESLSSREHGRPRGDRPHRGPGAAPRRRRGDRAGRDGPVTVVDPLTTGACGRLWPGRGVVRSGVNPLPSRRTGVHAGSPVPCHDVWGASHTPANADERGQLRPRLRPQPGGIPRLASEPLAAKGSIGIYGGVSGNIDRRGEG